MKINGEKIEGVNVATMVFPRENGKAIVLKAQGVLSFDGFNKLCPLPIAPLIKRPGKPDVMNVKDKKYLDEIDMWATKKTHWMILESLRATPGLEWETVVEIDSDTWGNYVQELRDAGVTDAEMNYIQRSVANVCGLNEGYIKQATESFLADQALQQGGLFSQEADQKNMPSGEPASDFK